MGDLPNDRWIRRAMAARIYGSTPPAVAPVDTTQPGPPASPYAAWLVSIRVARDALGKAITTDPNQYFPQMHAFFSAIEMLVECGDPTSALNELRALQNHIGTFVRYLQTNDQEGHTQAQDLWNTADYYIAAISGDTANTDRLASDLFHSSVGTCHSIHGRADTMYGDAALDIELTLRSNREVTNRMIDASLYDAYTNLLGGGQAPGPVQALPPSIHRIMDADGERDAGFKVQSTSPPRSDE